jgi:hypothetical protein
MEPVVQLRVVAVGAVQEDALLADEDHAAFACELDVGGQHIGTGWIDPAVVPKQFDGRLRATRCELIMHAG